MLASRFRDGTARPPRPNHVQPQRQSQSAVPLPTLWPNGDGRRSTLNASRCVIKVFRHQRLALVGLGTEAVT